MAASTVDVTVLVSDQAGSPVSGAEVSCKLVWDDLDPSAGYVSPEEQTATTDANGEAVIAVWPNELGATSSTYRFSWENPDTGRVTTVYAAIPNRDCQLHLVAELPPFDARSKADVAGSVAIATMDTMLSNAQDSIDAAMTNIEAYSETATNAADAAGASETATATSETNAAASAAAAAASESNAADSETAADAAATAAETARDDTLAALLTLDIVQIQGSLDCSTNPNYPAANAGDMYVVTVGGKIGGASGPDVTAGKLVICYVDDTVSGDHATVGANWVITQTSVDLSAYIAKSIGTAAGDIIVFTASGAPVRLAAGTEGQGLVITAGVPAWGQVATEGGGVGSTIFLYQNYGR